MNGASTCEVINRIRMEYGEMPDLKLTSAQARRLWNLSDDSCDAALADLVQSGFLYRTRDGSFLRCDRRITLGEPQATGAKRVW
jgi:hypothetical protein